MEVEKRSNEEEMRRLLLPNVEQLPLTPPSAVDSNFVSYFAQSNSRCRGNQRGNERGEGGGGVGTVHLPRDARTQYVYRHANGLCVIGLAPTHIAFRDKEEQITAVDFNVGKSDRSEFKVSGKRKKNAQHFESNTALCKVFVKDTFYIVRCCVKGSLLEVNDRLIQHSELLNLSAGREGYIAIIMPKPADWLKIKNSLLNLEDYKKLKDLS